MCILDIDSTRSSVMTLQLLNVPDSAAVRSKVGPYQQQQGAVLEGMQWRMPVASMDYHMHVHVPFEAYICCPLPGWSTQIGLQDLQGKLSSLVKHVHEHAMNTGMHDPSAHQPYGT